MRFLNFHLLLVSQLNTEWVLHSRGFKEVTLEPVCTFNSVRSCQRFLVLMITQMALVQLKSSILHER